MGGSHDKEAFLAFCVAELGTEPDYPFDEDFKTAVLRHKGSRKWFAVVMRVSRRKFGLDSDEAVDIVNLKIPLEMFGFSTAHSLPSLRVEI